MYNQQQQNFHTAAYRGNQAGHDAYLHSDSQQPTAQSQYRGYQKAYQPTGNVQSFYQGGSNVSGSFAGQGVGATFQSQTPSFQSQTPSFQSQAPIQSGYQQQSFVSPDSFHAANYRGNQPGHDAYLRSDSQQPQSQIQAQSQFQTQQAQPQYGSSLNANINSFHAANYRGNQPGHDNYLRSDSANPAQFQSQFQPTQQSFQPIQNQNQFGYRN